MNCHSTHRIINMQLIIQKPYTKGEQKEYAHDIIDRLKSGELMHADSIKYIDSLKVNTLKLGRPI